MTRSCCLDMHAQVLLPQASMAACACTRLLFSSPLAGREAMDACAFHARFLMLSLSLRPIVALGRSWTWRCTCGCRTHGSMHMHTPHLCLPEYHNRAILRNPSFTASGLWSLSRQDVECLRACMRRGGSPGIMVRDTNTDTGI